MPTLPSLKGLRAVESSARLGSFTAAAQELSVTQTAVSRLVKDVEAQLGVSLFERQANTLTLTPAGTRLLPHLSAAFARLIQGVDEARTQPTTQALTIGCGPTFAIRWLIPRLARFHSQHPGIDVRVATAMPSEAPALHTDWAAAIRMLPALPPGMHGDALFRPRLLPVCRPDIATRLHHPRDLANETLLATFTGNAWPRWFAAVGLPSPSTPPHLFDFSAFALQGALDGLGIALAWEPYVVDDLAAGRLIAPFDATTDETRSWYLLYRETPAADSALDRFRGWMADEIARSPLAAAGRLTAKQRSDPNPATETGRPRKSRYQ